MRIVLFHNRSAGGGDSSSPEELHRAFADAGYDPVLHSKADGPFDDDKSGPIDMVVVVGGDGTVADAVVKLGGSAPLFSIVPTGTANNIATTLAISGTAKEIALGLRDGKQRALDIGRVAGVEGYPIFFEAVGIGLVAASLAENKGKGLSGKEKTRAGRESLGRMLESAVPEGIRAMVDGAPLPDDLIFLEMLNIPFSGPSLHLAASAKPRDGLLDVAFLRPGGKTDFMAAFHADPEGPLPLEVVRGRRVELTWNGQALRIDDHFPKPPQGPRELSVTLAETPVRFLVPSR